MTDTFLYMELIEQLKQFNIEMGAIGGGMFCIGLALLLGVIACIIFYLEKGRDKK